jgi:hypothetical protein
MPALLFTCRFSWSDPNDNDCRHLQQTSPSELPAKCRSVWTVCPPASNDNSQRWHTISCYRPRAIFRLFLSCSRLSSSSIKRSCSSSSCLAILALKRKQDFFFKWSKKKWKATQMTFTQVMLKGHGIQMLKSAYEVYHWSLNHECVQQHRSLTIAWNWMSQ